MNAAETIDTLSNVESEAALIGALMMDNRLVDKAADALTQEDFADPLLGRIFGAIVSEVSQGRAANALTLKPFFVNDPQIAEVGGVSFLANLTGSVAVIIGASGFVEQIGNLAQRRRLVEGLRATMELASDPYSTTEELIDAADGALMEATHKGDPIHQPSAVQCVDEFIRSYDDPKSGVECKVIPSIDGLLGPLRPKQLIIGAGRPGMGKTATALSYALGAAQNGHGVLFVSLEMGSQELAGRMLSDMCFDGRGGVPYEVIRDGRADRNQMRQIVQARDMIADLPFQIVDAGKLTIGRLGMIVRRWKRRYAAKGISLDLVVVDYLQLLSPDTKGRSNYEGVSEVSRGLKAIAKDQGVAMLALAQLSREAEKRPDKRPQLSDLRDSGQIEQDADAVLFLFRLEYYLRQNEPEETALDRLEWEDSLRACQNRIEFICAKRRNGRTGSCHGEFWGGNQAVRG